jgi:hypothetical protein
MMLIFIIKTDKDNTSTPLQHLHLALEKPFFLRKNRPGTQEKTKQDFENKMRLSWLCVDSF